MNDIEFGLGGDEDVPEVPAPSKPVTSVQAQDATPVLAAPAAPSLVEPEPDASLPYAGESASPATPPTAHPSFAAHDATAQGSGGFLGVQQSLDRPLSEDLRALGSMMTGMVA